MKRCTGQGMREGGQGFRGTHRTISKRPRPVSKILNCLSETTDPNCKSCGQDTCRERALTSSCTWNQSFAPLMEAEDQDMTRTGHWDAGRSEGPLVQDDAEPKPLTQGRREALPSRLPLTAHLCL